MPETSASELSGNTRKIGCGFLAPIERAASITCLSTSRSDLWPGVERRRADDQRRQGRVRAEMVPISDLVNGISSTIRMMNGMERKALTSTQGSTSRPPGSATAGPSG